MSIAETAPGIAYAVEVTSISAFFWLVIETRADQSIPAAHTRPAIASTTPRAGGRSVLMGKGYAGGNLGGIRPIGRNVVCCSWR